MHIFHRTTRYLIVFVLAAFLVATFGSLRAVAQTSGGLDVVLLVDSSGSMGTSDPDGFRTVAAHFLLDYLQALGEVQGITHRFAAANFDTDLIAGDTVPLTVLQGDASQGILPPRVRGDTDFAPPLAFAQEVRTQTGMENPMVVFLFTDGDPKPLGIEGLDGYFTTLRPQVESLQATGAQIFVIALGDEAASHAYWVDLLGADHFRRITTATDLAGVYRELLADLLGLRGDSGRTLLEGSTQTIVLEPLLERVVFSLIKSAPGAQVTLQDPDNALVPPARGGGANDLHAIYVVETPPNSTATAPWRISIQGGQAEVWVDQKLPTLMLDAPDSPQPTGVELDFTGRLMQGSLPVVDAELALTLSVLNPAGEIGEIAMTSRSGGAYTATFTPGDLPGVYTLTLAADYAGAPLLTDHQPVPLTVAAAPFIESLDTDGALFVSQLLTMTARVANPAQIGPATTLQVRLLDVGGVVVGEANLLDDGQTPDAQAGDGLFAAVLTLPTTAGRYTLEGVIGGTSVDGLPLDFSLQKGVLEVDVAPPVKTVTPVTPEPTEAPTQAPTPPSTPDFWERFLPQSVETTSDSYSFWLTLGLIVGTVATTAYILWQIYRFLQNRGLAINLREFLRSPFRGLVNLAAGFRDERNLRQQDVNDVKEQAADLLERAEKAEQARDYLATEKQKYKIKKARQASKVGQLWRSFKQSQTRFRQANAQFLKQKSDLEARAKKAEQEQERLETEKQKYQSKRARQASKVGQLWQRLKKSQKEYQSANAELQQARADLQYLKSQLNSYLEDVKNADNKEDALEKSMVAFDLVETHEIKEAEKVVDELYQIIRSLMEKHFADPDERQQQIEKLALRTKGTTTFMALSRFVLREEWGKRPQQAIKDIYSGLKTKENFPWKRLLFFVSREDAPETGDISNNVKAVTQLTDSLQAIYASSDNFLDTPSEAQILIANVRDSFQKMAKDTQKNE